MAAIRGADTVRPVMEARAAFLAMAVRVRAMADRMERRATAGVPRAAAVGTPVAVVGTRAEVEEAIPAVAGTPVAAVILAVTTKHQVEVNEVNNRGEKGVLMRHALSL